MSDEHVTTMPAGSEATYFIVLRTVSGVRYMVTPSQEKNDGAAAEKPPAASAEGSVCVSKSIGTKLRVGGTAMAAAASRPRFHACVAGWSTSKTRSSEAG